MVYHFEVHDATGEGMVITRAAEILRVACCDEKDEFNTVERFKAEVHAFAHRMHHESGMDFDPNLMVTYEIFEHVLESCPEICDAIHNQLWCKVGPERKMDALKFHGAEISERFNELESSRSLSKKDPTGFQVQVTTNLNVGSSSDLFLFGKSCRTCWSRQNITWSKPIICRQKCTRLPGQ